MEERLGKIWKHDLGVMLKLGAQSVEQYALERSPGLHTDSTVALGRAQVYSERKNFWTE